jgi:hypothetical protein
VFVSATSLGFCGESWFLLQELVSATSFRFWGEIFVWVLGQDCSLVFVTTFWFL